MTLMQGVSSTFTLPLRDIEAVLFDLDGVATQTATLHTAAWKELFDGYLKAKADRDNTPFRSFDAEADYQQYVDGKPRYVESARLNLPGKSASDTFLEAA